MIRVRDIARHTRHELGPQEPVLRGTYDLFQPMGPALRRGTLVDWVQARVIRSARVAPTVLGEAHPGERVLVRLPPFKADEWWLCEVEAVDGVTVD